MGYLDPGFDPTGVLDVLGDLVTARGGRATIVGPEWPWVAGELLAFADVEPATVPGALPLAARAALDDRRTCPRSRATRPISADARLFESVPGLAGAPVEIAFLDMADFGSWNTRHGQAAGDELLARLTAAPADAARSRGRSAMAATSSW